MSSGYVRRLRVPLPIVSQISICPAEEQMEAILVLVSELKPHQMSMIPLAQSFQRCDLLLERIQGSITGSEALHRKVRILTLSLHDFN